jgi:hypothetical protein
MIVLTIHQGGVRSPEYAMLAYGPADGRNGTWEDIAPRRAMDSIFEYSEPR